MRILCFCNVWTEKKNVYRKTGNGIAFARKQRYVDISCQNIGSPESRVFILVALARVSASNWFNIMSLY